MPEGMGGEAYPNLGLGERITMYYVIQVAPREENNVETLIRELLPSDVCRQCFHLRRHMLKKYHGEWHDVHEKLLPGYIFVETDDIEPIYEVLQKIERFSKILGWTEESIIDLTDNDTMWLECLLKYCDDYTYEIPLSEITICNNIISFISGPLKEMKSLIKKFNIHKRIAEVHVKLGGRTFVLHMGMNILSCFAKG